MRFRWAILLILTLVGGLSEPAIAVIRVQAESPQQILDQ